jgi:hypothetical protein
LAHSSIWELQRAVEPQRDLNAYNREQEAWREKYAMEQAVHQHQLAPNSPRVTSAHLSPKQEMGTSFLDVHTQHQHHQQSGGGGAVVWRTSSPALSLGVRPPSAQDYALGVHAISQQHTTAHATSGRDSAVMVD